MVRKSHFDPQRVREEIAIAAARMIAEDGLDYSTAKRKAARQVVGETRVAGEWLPDNDQIEEEIREYQSLFQGDSQPARAAAAMRAVATRLDAAAPAVQSLSDRRGAERHRRRTLGYPSAVFCDNPKEVAIYLLNANVQYDVSETRHFAGRGYVETLSFLLAPHERRARCGAGWASTSRCTKPTTCAARYGPTRAAALRGQISRRSRRSLDNSNVTPSTN